MKDDIDNIQNEANSIPEVQLTKLFDRSGSNYGGNKGFILFYINEQGNPFAVMKFENNAVRFALEKSLDMFKLSMEQSEWMGSIGIDVDEEGDSDK